MMKKFATRALLTGMIAIAGFTSLTVGAPQQASAATEKSLALVSVGQKYLGTPYLYGATPGSTSYFDCSSYVQHVFGEMGVWLPRTSAAQAWMGKKVDKAYLSVGDLVFFRTGGSGISHVGIYAGDGKMLNTTGNTGVALVNMNSTYWKNTYVTARRVL